MPMFRRLLQSHTHPAATPVRLKPSVDLSFSALLYCGSTFFIGIAAMNSQTNLLFAVFGLMIGIMLVAGYISRFSLRKLVIRRAMPEYLIVGNSATILYRLVNAKRYWPSVSVSLGELDGCEAFTRQPYSYLLHVAAQMQTTVAAELIPKRRGIHELNRYQISTSFPFGFVKHAAILPQKETIIVFPALGRVDKQVLSLCQSSERSGAPMRPRKGGNDEFYGVKEYRTGENPRLIYWKRSARTGTLVSREMTHVSPPRLLLLVDTYQSEDAPCNPADVERTIAMAASLASLALEEGYPVGLFTWSNNYQHIPPQRGKRQRLEILTILARLEPNHRHSSEDLLQAASHFLETGTTTVVLTPQPHDGPLHPQRAQFVFLSSNDKHDLQWFNFVETVDFSHCMPVNQESLDFKPADISLANSTT